MTKPIPSWFRLYLLRFALKLIYGLAAEVITKGAKVQPARLLDEGFKFKFPTLSEALTDLTK